MTPECAYAACIPRVCHVQAQLQLPHASTRQGNVACIQAVAVKSILLCITARSVHKAPAYSMQPAARNALLKSSVWNIMSSWLMLYSAVSCQACHNMIRVSMRIRIASIRVCQHVLPHCHCNLARELQYGDLCGCKTVVWLRSCCLGFQASPETV